MKRVYCLFFIAIFIGFVCQISCQTRKSRVMNLFPELPSALPKVPIEKNDVELVWKELEEKFGVRRSGDNQLIAHDGSTFQRQVWSDLEGGLRFELKRSLFAKAMYDAYAKHVLPLIQDDNDLKDHIEYWIYSHSRLLGSITSDPKAMLLNDEFFKKNQDANYVKAMDRFFEDVLAFESKGWKNRYYDQARPSSNQKRRIAIIGTSAFGGGHYTVAKSIRDAIQYQFGSQFEIKVIDTRKLEPEKDNMMRITGGGLHSENIYDEFFQKEDNPKKASAFWKVHSEISYFINDDSTQVLLDDIRQFQPDLIFSCIHHRPELINLAYATEVPLRIVSTDFDLQPHLFSYVQTLNPSLVKILVSTLDPIFFESLAQHMQRPDIEGFYAPVIKDSIQSYVDKKISTSELFKNVSVFERFGIPTSPEIQKVQDSKMLELYREQFKIRKQSKILTLAMGRQGAGNLKSMVLDIKSVADKLPETDVLVLCGSNETLKAELQTLTEGTAAGVRFHLLSLLDSKDMSKIYNITDLLVSKPGGVTTAEVEVTRTPVLAYIYYPWEEINLSYLKRQDLGFDKGEDFLSSLQKLLAKDFSETKKKSAILDWNNELVALLKNKDIYLYPEESYLPQDVWSALREAGYHSLGKKPLVGFENYVHRVADHDGQTWVVKIPKESSPTPMKTIKENLESQLQLFSMLSEEFSGNFPRMKTIRAKGEDYKLTEWVFGPTLLEILTETQGLSMGQTDKLRDFYHELVEKKPWNFVSDVHGGNIIWNQKTHEWVVIDTNGMKEAPLGAAISYYNDLLIPWSNEVNNNPDLMFREKAKKIFPALIDVLKERVLSEYPQIIFDVFAKAQPFFFQMQEGEYLSFQKSGSHLFSSKSQVDAAVIKATFQPNGDYCLSLQNGSSKGDELFLGVQHSTKNLRTKSSCGEEESFYFSYDKEKQHLRILKKINGKMYSLHNAKLTSGERWEVESCSSSWCKDKTAKFTPVLVN